MKLLYCKKCHDIFRIHKEITYCQCKETFGKYLNRINAVYSGSGIPLGIANESFKSAISVSDSLIGREFTAFVISPIAKSFQYTKEIK